MKIRFFLFASLFFSFSTVYGQQSDCGDPDEQVINVIYMIGDGMGVAHVTQLIIEENMEKIQMERAHAVGLVRTFSANNRVTDSAAAGTALATGTKTNNGTLGIDPEGNNLRSVMMRAQDKGMKTGFVVTVQLGHATPAAFYANNPDRRDYEEINLDLLNSGIDLFLGGGQNNLIERKDGRNLAEELMDKDYRVIFDEQELESITEGKVAGAFTKKGAFPYVTKGRNDFLPRASAKAMEILKNNAGGNEGFFLMIEGSLIDYAGHDNDAKALLGEMKDFDDAVGVAFDFADRNPGTLVIVLADHETGGLTIPSNNSDFTSAEKGIKYRFSTGSHTASLIPLFAYGTGAHNFSRVLDNTEVPKIIARLLGLEL